jgi:hypothetical protein
MGALSAARQGLFKPPSPLDGLDFADLQALVAQALKSLGLLGRDEMNALEGTDMVFQLGERRLRFLAEDFLLSFSVPNFYFHTTTAYDLLRLRGMPLAKRDYLGRLRLNG